MAADLRTVAPPRRLPPPVPSSRPRPLPVIQLAAAFTWLALGVAFLAPTAWRSPTTYRPLTAVMPLDAWGAVFLVTAAGQLVASWNRRPTRGLAVGAAIAAAWSASLVAAALAGRLADFTLPVLWAFLAAAQILEAFDHHRRR